MRFTINASRTIGCLLFAEALLAASLLNTHDLGGALPSLVKLSGMQKGSYVLRVRNGKITRVPAEKSTLPNDPEGHVQAVAVAFSPRGAVFVNQRSIMCKSTDGGRTWTSFKRHKNSDAGFFQILRDGTFIGIQGMSSPNDRGPIRILYSGDEGLTWTRRSEISMPAEVDQRYTYALFRLPDDTLLCGVSCRIGFRATENWGKWQSGVISLRMYRSTDGGRNWTGPASVADWGHEGGLARMASGRLLSVIRYQRPLLAGDPSALIRRTGKDYHAAFGRWPEFPYKHLFLADSDDGGVTWKNQRQLTSVFGQCFGFGVGLPDGTAVVVHDDRYPRERSTGRAMISRDEGRTWENEAYYLFYGAALSGYSQSVALPDGTILTVGGTSAHPPGRESWNALLGHSDFTAIRWRPAPRGR